LIYLGRASGFEARLTVFVLKSAERALCGQELEIIHDNEMCLLELVNPLLD
jgi:hypothetical protein